MSVSLANKAQNPLLGHQPICNFGGRTRPICHWQKWEKCFLTQKFKVERNKSYSPYILTTNKVGAFLPIALSQAWKLAIVQTLLFLLDRHLLSAPMCYLHMVMNTTLLNSKQQAAEKK